MAYRQKTSSTANRSHLEPITIVEDGVITINNFPAKKASTIVDLIFIIFDLTVLVNGTKFINRDNVEGKFSGFASTSLLNTAGYDPVLSLTLLQRLNEQNLHVIQQIRDEVSSSLELE